ncbi:MAG: DUF4139 domain-containing protein [Thermodesulfobacteriota bacterium]|nr:DUF4139 domain-containing protein [Thermodesulfobacteriota bacterium]
MLRRIIGSCFVVLLLVSPVGATLEEKVTSLDDQKSISVTIYNQNLALVKDLRAIRLPTGESSLAFREVSARIRPETALLKSSGLSVIEQNFEFDLLTPQALLKKYVGKEVAVVRVHPTTGEESRELARVLSVNDGVVLRVADHIEMGIPGRLVFPDIPGNLRDRPTLVLHVNSPTDGLQDVELSYLTGGLNWQADYVAELNATDDGLDINGWVTLTNRSGTTYPDARLQLVAGDVHQAPPEQRQPARYQQKAAAVMMAEMNDSMAEESMFEYHLYSLSRPTTIKDNQTKQVALLQASRIPCKKEFVLRGSDYYYSSRYDEIEKKIKIGVFVEVKNSRENNLGLPMPKGVIRVYKKDSKDSLQFIGEDRIDHTPENETIRLKLGDAFDVTADKKQTDFKKISGFSRYHYVYDSSFQIDLKNAKKEAITVKVVEPIPGDWEMSQESHKHEKPASHRAVWYVPIPAQGKATLTYTVRVKY